MKLFPDYPRESGGAIPEALCLDVIRIWPELGGAYLWDMNGASITVGCITGKDDDPWDEKFSAWQDIFESKPLTDNADPQWKSDHERALFDQQGHELAQQLFDFFDQKRTVVYYDLDRRQTWFNALGKPPIRLTDEE